MLNYCSLKLWEQNCVEIWAAVTAADSDAIEAMAPFNTLRPRQDGRHFPDGIFKCIFSSENVSISINISVKFVPKSQINNIPALVHIMACRRPGDKPLSEPMMVILLTHICVTRPPWVNRTLVSQLEIWLKSSIFEINDSQYPWWWLIALEHSSP